MSHQRTWLITGISSGFGRVMTEQLLAGGDRVVGTVLKPEAVADLGAAEELSDAQAAMPLPSYEGNPAR